MGEMPYIGAKISLISKGDIRYEGTLYSIDMNESTIALHNVKSFGTEDRRQDGTFLPPSGEIYEYIIFKGADIKDLAVLQNEPPADADASKAPEAAPQGAPAPPQAPPQPPAPSPWGAPPPQQPYSNVQWSAPSQQPGPGAPPPYYAQTPVNPAQSAAPETKPANAAPPAQPSAASTARPGPAPAPTVVITPSAPARGPRPQPQRASPAGPQHHQQHPLHPPPGMQNYPRANGPPAGHMPNGAPPRQGPPSGPPAPRPRPTSYAGAAGGRGPARGRGVGGPPGLAPAAARGGGRVGGRGQGPPPAPRAPPVPVPREDFNFEEAFQKFKKEARSPSIISEVKPEVVKEEEAPKETYKADDFFDSLSCEALERLAVSEGAAPEKPQARTRFAEQRKVDIETFGGTGIARRNDFRRGRGRGGRRGGGRQGGYQNGGGRGGSSNPTAS
ncbi:hypothetical protein COCSUDRAFT_59550 [Coccomyxa subellipsoidea C-169]|uniref:TFG box profile domain-containing protein n=1 Tax=Coccomyxa subellipsoidea (strain C-169) TaxID=574566 RepID=I0YKZ5_COCSC|nr:hypothetical protein COCSUDRAFT_59550 [Coccomyxa subellipsoidea C-169]EIE19064.1 hypothetical protein COCSUDRAFT_59550 [Coccomyxa subellipsoidea C-169]|eukprot:XP_005643608.1 hypothetical protein COCSUDRAFT_59550 [Coccomyxa subellipsoidea C-169]